MYQCRECGERIVDTDMGWVHKSPVDPSDPRICYWTPVLASPVLA
jgi:hypothetical protein